MAFIKKLPQNPVTLGRLGKVYRYSWSPKTRELCLIHGGNAKIVRMAKGTEVFSVNPPQKGEIPYITFLKKPTDDPIAEMVWDLEFYDSMRKNSLSDVKEKSGDKDIVLEGNDFIFVYKGKGENCYPSFWYAGEKADAIEIKEVLEKFLN